MRGVWYLDEPRQAAGFNFANDMIAQFVRSLLGAGVSDALLCGEGEGHDLEPAAKSAVSNSAPEKLRGVKRYLGWHECFTSPLISVQNLKAKRH